MNSGFTKTEAALLDALERERALLRQRDLLNGIVVHEMANAVTIVASTTDLLRTSKPGSPLFDFALMQLRGGARTLSDMLGGLRILTDRTGDLPVFSPGDLAAFTREVVTDPVLIADTAPRRVVFANRAACATSVFCAPLLRHALANLVRNALKYSPASSTVRVLMVGRDDRRWIHVLNRGPKIATDIASHIFEPGRKGSKGGMGLGLHIARACALRMGGELNFGSTSTATVFSIMLPKCEPTPGPPSPASAPAAAPTPPMPHREPGPISSPGEPIALPVS
jgi:signal transduction histidine kinase